MKYLTLLFCAAAALSAQTQINGGRTILGPWDASGATWTRPLKTGTTLPSTCTVGDMFFKSDASAAANLYGCTGVNTWTVQGTAAGVSLLNGLSGSVSLLIGSSGTAPNWAGATFNLPAASAPGVTGGLLSKTKYDEFDAKVSSDVVTLASLSIAASQVGSGIFSVARGGTNAGSFTGSRCIESASDGLSLVVASAPCSSGGSAFSAVTNGTNTTAAMVVGAGASLTTSGLGTINANRYNGTAQVQSADIADLSATYILASRINAASGVAGLSAGSKLTASQGQEVWAIADMTDYSGSSGAGATAIKSTITSAATNDLLGWSGTDWVNFAIANGFGFAWNCSGATCTPTVESAVIESRANAQLNGSTSATTTGSATAYAVVLNPVLNSYSNLVGVRIKMDETSGASPTLDAGPGAKAIYKRNGSSAAVAIGTGELIANQTYALLYNTSLNGGAGGWETDIGGGAGGGSSTVGPHYFPFVGGYDTAGRLLVATNTASAACEADATLGTSLGRRCYVPWQKTGADTSAIIPVDVIPVGWSGGTITFSIWFRGNGSGNAIQYSVETMCLATTETDPGTWNTAQNMSSVTTTAEEMRRVSIALTTTGCAAEEMLNVRIMRVDTSGYADVFGADFKYAI